MEEYHGELLREAEKIEKEGVVEREVSKEEKIKEIVKTIEEERRNIID